MPDPHQEPDRLLQHQPPAPAVPPQLDLHLLTAEAEQIARADIAGGVLDVETVLAHDGEFIHERVIGRRVARAQREADEHIAYARMFGRLLEDGIASGAVADERSVGAGPVSSAGELEREPLPRMTEELAVLRRRIKTLRERATQTEGFLRGDSTDAAGVDYSTRVPEMSLRSWKRRKWISKFFVAPLETLFLYFTLRLTINSEGRGAWQILSGIGESIAVVGISLIVTIAMPSLLADRVARLRRSAHAQERPASERRHDVAVAVLLLVIALMMVGLLAWLRAAYLSAAVTEGARIQIPFLWFLLISVVWLLAPQVIVYVLSRAQHHWNDYVPGLLGLREEIAALVARCTELRVAIALRKKRVKRQRQVTEEVLAAWQVYRDEVLPAGAAEAGAAYLDQLVRAAGDPQFTDAVLVNLEARRKPEAGS